MADMPTRKCPKCGEEKDCDTGFYDHRNGGRVDGKRSRCKECFNTGRRVANIKPARRDFTCAACGSGFRREDRSGSRQLCDACGEIGRICPRCKKFKQHDRFYVHRTPAKGTRYCRDGCVQAANRERLYGLKPGTAEAVLSQFAAVCGICGATGSGSTRTSDLFVDHCHATGVIRGWLCHSCNFGLGYFKDDPDRLLAAVKYLRQHAANARLSG